VFLKIFILAVATVVVRVPEIDEPFEVNERHRASCRFVPPDRSRTTVDGGA
jgi:hypothetical protein